MTAIGSWRSREKLAKMRTREAVAKCRSDLWDLPEIDFSRADLGLDEKTLAELRKRILEGEVAGALGAELERSVWLAKKVVLERAVKDRISGADLGRYAVGLFEDEHAAYFASRMVCPGLAFLRSPEQARELHGLKSKHPELDPFQCHSPGTYVIVVIYTNANGQPEAGVYVGAAYDQTVAERSEQHDRRFRLLKAAEKADDKDEVARLSDGQNGLYRRDTIDRYHFVLTRTSPPGVDAERAKASSRYAEMLAYKLFGKCIDRLGPKNAKLVDQLVIRMIVAFDEHIGCALFGSSGSTATRRSRTSLARCTRASLAAAATPSSPSSISRSSASLPSTSTARTTTSTSQSRSTVRSAWPGS